MKTKTKNRKCNALVAQSGGPSPVINASLQGVIEACRDYPDSIGRLFAAWHGIEGVMEEQLVDTGKLPQKEVSLLKYTPASGSIGTCRYKLKPEQAEDFDRILSVFQAHDIGYFFYIGGNDSMDTAAKVADLAHERGYPLIAVGVPKTIDNDVGDPGFKMIDHTPGYGSTARYWAYLMQNIDEENRAMSPSECVLVFQAMGRKAGFIPAAARLGDPERKMPLQIYMAEAHHTLGSLTDNVNRQLCKTGRCIVVVSEGFDVGSLGEARDGFGHIEYGASKMAAAQIVANHLNEKGLKARGQATWQVPGVIQRSTSIFASSVDIEEAYEVGRKAVAIGVKEGSGWMATILRKPGRTYRAYYDKVPLKEVANSFRQLPANWISKDGLDVTDDFVRYAEPLIGADWPPIRMEDRRQRFARIPIRFVDRLLKPYTPLGYR